MHNTVCTGCSNRVKGLFESGTAIVIEGSALSVLQGAEDGAHA